MTLPTRALGTSGLRLTTVGFGAWAAGGGGWSFGWGPQDDEASIAAMRHAIDRGVNWIDTAAVYGLGHSEEVVGRFLRTLAPADRPLRLHQVRPGVGSAGPDEGVPPNTAPRFDPARMRRIAAPARRRANRPLPVSLARRRGVPIEDSWDAMTRLVDQGKIRAVGRVELRRRPARTLRGATPRRFAAAAVLDDQARGRRRAAAVVRGARNRRHLLQPDAVGHPDRHVQCGTGRGVRAGRLAPAGARFKSPQLERNLALRDA